MTKREKLFEKLNEMDNEELSLSINLTCGKSCCPCFNLCRGDDGLSCNETLRKWLDETDE